MGLRELGLAAILLGAGCAQPEVKTIEARLAEDSYYNQGVKLMNKAETEADKKRQYDLYSAAFNTFEISRKNEGTEYDSLLRQADCVSRLGDFLESVKMVEGVIARCNTGELKANAYNLEGTIALRHKIPEFAIQCYTDSIKENDNPVARWNRFDTRLQLMKDGDIRLDYLDSALEDAKKYSAFKPEEPDGYAAQYLIHAFRLTVKAQHSELDINPEQELKASYEALKQVFSKKTEFKRALFKDQADSLKTVYEALKQKYSREY